MPWVTRSMKVAGGLIGITQNVNARAKFSLAAPELACLAEEAREPAGLPSTMHNSVHHELRYIVAEN